MNGKYGTELLSRVHTHLSDSETSNVQKVQPARIEGVSKECQTNLNIEGFKQLYIIRNVLVRCWRDTLLNLYYYSSLLVVASVND